MARRCKKDTHPDIGVKGMATIAALLGTGMP
jgi:hypothetical protein